MTTIHTRQLQQYTRPTHKNYTQDNLKLATIHTRQIRIQHVQKVKKPSPSITETAQNWNHHSLTHSMQQSPSWEANRFSGCQEIPQHLVEHKGSLPLSQEPSNCPYPEPALSSPYPHTSPTSPAQKLSCPSHKFQHAADERVLVYRRLTSGFLRVFEHEDHTWSYCQLVHLTH